MFYLKNLYCDSTCEVHEGHAMVEEGVPGGVAWVICHGACAYCLLFCGVGFKLIFASMPGDPKSYYRGIFACSLAGAVVLLLIIRTSHDKFIFHPLSALRIFPVAAIVASAWFLSDPNEFR